jgi:multiple sugar transport system ATP-binding protein
VHARLGAIGETIVAKISPAEASSLTTGMPVSVEIEPDRAMLFAASGERLRAKTVAAAAALEKAHG